jgi:hypothetical protein
VAIENILIELKTPTWFPSTWFLERSGIYSFKVINLEKLAPQNILS